jgi:hypothetical protein
MNQARTCWFFLHWFFLLFFMRVLVLLQYFQ